MLVAWLGFALLALASVASAEPFDGYVLRGAWSALPGADYCAHRPGDEVVCTYNGGGPVNPVVELVAGDQLFCDRAVAAGAPVGVANDWRCSFVVSLSPGVFPCPDAVYDWSAPGFPEYAVQACELRVYQLPGPAEPASAPTSYNGPTAGDFSAFGTVAVVALSLLLAGWGFMIGKGVS